MTPAKKGAEPWSEGEVKTFLASLAGHRMRAPQFLSLMGLRPAELCGLRWSDVDLGAGTLSIANTRTMTYVVGQGNTTVEKPPKTDNGKRTLPLPNPVVAALRQLQATQEADTETAGEAYEASGYVLVDELGKPFRTDKFRRETRKLMSAAGVRVVKPYNARHACLTYLLGAGVPDVIVSAWADPADLSLAKRVYSHPTAEHLQQGSDALAALFAG